MSLFLIVICMIIMLALIYVLYLNMYKILMRLSFFDMLFVKIASLHTEEELRKVDIEIRPK